MKTTQVTKEQVLAMNVTELRKVATAAGIKSVAKFAKVDLQKAMIKTLPKETKVVNKAVKTTSAKKSTASKAVAVVKSVGEKVMSKSQLLRKEIRESLKKGLSIDSGRLMKVMEEKHGVTMHRSFIITVRNKAKMAS